MGNSFRRAGPTIEIDSDERRRRHRHERRIVDIKWPKRQSGAQLSDERSPTSDVRIRRRELLLMNALSTSSLPQDPGGNIAIVCVPNGQ